MKFLLKLILVFFVLLWLIGCGGPTKHNPTDPPGGRDLRYCYLGDDMIKISFFTDEIGYFTDSTGRRHVGFNNAQGIFVLDQRDGKAGQCFRLP